jgi:hypothetical protein
MKKPIGNNDTAFRWFLKKVQESGCWAVFSNNIPHEIIEEALEKEMEQIVDAWEAGYERDFAATGENYYVEQFGFVRE